MLKKAPQMASRWPSWPQLGSSWRHLGSKLAPSCPIWARFWSIRARPKLTKISQDSFWQIFCLKVAPKSSQTPSRPRFFKFSGPFFKGFRQFFRIPFYRFRFKVYSFLDTFSLIFFDPVPLERSRRERGRRYSPAGRLRYIYIYMCFMYALYTLCIRYICFAKVF